MCGVPTTALSGMGGDVRIWMDGVGCAGRSNVRQLASDHLRGWLKSSTRCTRLLTPSEA